MPDVTRILVPVDFSEGSRGALRYAELLSTRFGAEIVALHVWEPAPVVAPDQVTWIGGDADTFWRSMSDDLKRRLEGLDREEVPAIASRVRVEIDAGYVAHTILRKLEREGFDLVVMGTHGRTGRSHVLIGSVAERVVRLAPVPVVTVRATQKARAKKREPVATGSASGSETPAS
jgi:nucleotide-binding universal stress UspA family protein